MIWAPGVKGKDITDYHIDALARFVSPGRVLIQLPDRIDPSDPWSASAYETYAILKKATDANGRKLDIIVVPEPVDIRSQNDDFVASYVNYYVCNGAIISAEFGDDAADQKAFDLLKLLYPGREIISLNIDAIGDAGGGIHCATQQQPKAGKSLLLKPRGTAKVPYKRHRMANPSVNRTPNSCAVGFPPLRSGAGYFQR